MTDSMMYAEEMYVFLTPDAVETFMTPPELAAKLQAILENHDGPMPRELQGLGSHAEQAKFLLENHCDFEVNPGESVQWYAVRLEK
ncbi:MAG: chlororespiratory reduction protein 7 [Leptolyngbya foveolarum]|uniref:Chlororespiratory reduction protein 7 n=1 Tax=Leptolyngbya foveolarum TaxID=47253 RepID=A0A2W4UVZ7_9CYAN|nr:MAG: chlororespiratory reduction protein 7 [Leptolyngbya foveolarum]